MNNTPTTLDTEIEKILRHYREFADMAWSEVTDKVHTVEEYQEALDYLTHAHAQSITTYLQQEIIKELESYRDYWYNLGFRGDAMNDIDDRITTIKERTSHE